VSAIRQRLASLRERLSRRDIALIAILAIALSGTGISSLALLQDNVTATINASITTIDLNVNGTKNATITLPDGAIPGDFRFASLQFTNSGTGYVNVPSGSSVSAGGSSQLVADSQISVWQGVAPAQCNHAGLPGSGASFTNPRSLTTGLWDGEIVIAAGGSLDVCVWFRLGTTGANYTDGVSAFTMLNAFNAYYP
jgi:hypothetical protein